MRNITNGILCLAFLLSACSAQQRPTTLPTVAAIQPTAPAIPSPTPAGPEVVVTHPELEVISPENINRLEQIASWGEGRIYDYAVSPDRSMFAVSTARGVKIYNSITLDVVQNFAWDYLSAVGSNFPLVFSPEGSELFYSSGDRVLVVDVQTGQYKSTVTSYIPSFTIQNIQISEDGKNIFLLTRGSYAPCDGPGANLAYYWYDDDHWEYAYDKYGCIPFGNTAKFTADGLAYVLFTSDPFIVDILDLKTHELSGTLNLFDFGDNLGTMIDISYDGKYILFSSYFERNPTFHLVNKNTKEVKVINGDDIASIFSQQNPGKNLKTYEQFSLSDSLSDVITKCNLFLDKINAYELIAQSGELSTYAIVTYAGYMGFEIWNTNICERQKEIYPTKGSTPKFSLDGRLMIDTNGMDLLGWDVLTGELRYKLSSVGARFRLPIDEYAFSKDGLYLYTSTNGRGDNTDRNTFEKYSIEIRMVETGELVQTIITGDSFLREILPTTNSSVIAVEDEAGTKLWNIKTGQRIGQLPHGKILFTSDGSRVWVGDKDHLYKYDLITGKLLVDISVPFWSIEQIFENRDGSMLAVHGVDQESVGIWIYIDSSTGTAIQNVSSTSRETPMIVISDSVFETWEWFSPHSSQAIRPYKLINEIRDYESIEKNQFWSSGSDTLDEFLISPTGGLLLTISTDSEARFWDMRKGDFLGGFIYVMGITAQTIKSALSAPTDA